MARPRDLTEALADLEAVWAWEHEEDGTRLTLWHLRGDPEDGRVSVETAGGKWMLYRPEKRTAPAT